MQNIIVVIISLLLGSLGAWTIKNYGDKIGIIDVPNERSSHSKIVPKGGGIGILASFVLCSYVLGLSWSFWLPALVLSMVSFCGDKIELSAKLRLIIQFVCSFIFLSNLFYSAHMYLIGFLLIIPLSVFIVGSSNFYNFMDGINGIAGITGIVGFLLIAAYGVVVGGDSINIAMSTAVAFSCAGFLPFNIPTAKVFMGDVGSVLLGFVFACFVVIFSKSLLDFMCLTGFLLPFYADELVTMGVRIKNGEALDKPHRKHVYQLLVNECGIDHWKISVGYGVMQLFIGILLIILRNSGYIAVVTLLLSSFILFCIFSIVLRMKFLKNHPEKYEHAQVLKS